MSYDDGKNVVYVQKDLTSDQETVQKERMIQKSAELATINASISDAQKQLDQVNASIAARNADLQDAYEKQVSEVGSQLDILKAQINESQLTSTALDAAIKSKEDYRDNILNGLDVKQADIDAKYADIKKQADIIAQANVDVSAVKTDLDKRSADLDQKQKDLEDSITSQNEVLSQKSTLLAAQEETNNKVTADNQAKELDLASREAILLTSENELAQKQASANGVIAQGDIITAQAKTAADRLTQAQAIAKQNQDDINQIQVAKIALANQQADLNRRQQAVSAAEKTLANNGG